VVSPWTCSGVQCSESESVYGTPTLVGSLPHEPVALEHFQTAPVVRSLLPDESGVPMRSWFQPGISRSWRLPMNRLPIVLVPRPRSRARSGLFKDEDEGRARGRTSRSWLQRAISQSWRLSMNRTLVDCGGKRSATPLLEMATAFQSGVAAGLCHRSPRGSRPQRAFLETSKLSMNRGSCSCFALDVDARPHPGPLPRGEGAR